jgi:hypothetical protein
MKWAVTISVLYQLYMVLEWTPGGIFLSWSQTPVIYPSTMWLCSFGNQMISVGTLYPGETFRRLNLEIRLDSYIIDIRTRATPYGYFESLKLTEDNGQVHQSYYVRRVGGDKRLMDVP